MQVKPALQTLRVIALNPSEHMQLARVTYLQACFSFLWTMRMPNLDGALFALADDVNETHALPCRVTPCHARPRRA